MVAQQKHAKKARLEWWLAVLAVSMMLFVTACGSLTPKGQSAQHEQAKLDTEIQSAAKIGVPDSLLNPIRQQEAKVAGQLKPLGLFGDSNPDSAYESAIKSYQVLETEVVTVTNQALQTDRDQAHQDIQTLDELLQQRQNEGFSNEVPGYQARLTQIEQEFNDGVIPNDFLKVSADASQQTQALQLMEPAYQQLQTLQDSIKQMQNAGLNTTLGQQDYQNDLTSFRAASLPKHYQALMQTISAQLDQLAADQVSAIPFIGAAMLDNLQQLIVQAQTYGEDTTQYQQQLAQDRQDLQNAHTLQTYLDLSTRISAQVNTVRTAVARGKTSYDLQQLQALIGTTDIKNDYEYRDGTDDYGDQMANLRYARTADDYQAIDAQVEILLTNLHALLLNLNDPTPHDQPHATDLALIQEYGLTGKVMVTSLTEQMTRLYDNGQFVRAIPIVTGRQEAPSPAGLWHIFYMGTNLTFKSSDPPGSPLWYPPTPINYGMEYHADGFFDHDATWRSYFGPGANLPHPDYTSGIYSNNGSHGCINMRLSDTAFLYGWVHVGVPQIVY